MRRLTTKSRKWHAARARYEQRRRRSLAQPVYPSRYGEKYRQRAIAGGWLVLPAPVDLSWGVDTNLHLLCAYLAKIRRSVFLLNRRVVMDLSPCRRLSSVACLMLAAEIDRCQRLREGSINGLDPENRRAQQMLRAMGFYEHLKFNRPPLVDKPRGAIQIRSGLGSDETIASDAHEVSEVASEVFTDPNFAKRVHSALNEALGNVQMHAYEGADGNMCLSGRWWIAGLADHDDGALYFYALDHGIGIPATAPRNMGEALQAHLAKFLGPLAGKGARDHQILQAVVDERRTRTNKAQHGKGIASMISLIELAGVGEFHIYSGRGLYAFHVTQGLDTEPQAFAAPLGYTFPGTLLIWRVAGPTKDGEAEGDDDESDQNRD